MKPDVVLGMGGYAAGPVGLAAWLTRRPLVIHEQNSVAGTANRWLAPLARRVLCGLPGGFASDRKAEVVGNPVRQTLTPVDRGELNSWRFLCSASTQGVGVRRQPRCGTLERVTASRGKTVNGPGLGESLSLWQQCGERNRAEADAAWIDSPFNERRCDDFIDDMPAAYAWADVVIARAGALTVSELAATGTASILIPLPHAIDDHQTQNARVLANAGAAVLLPQSEAAPERLPGCWVIGSPHRHRWRDCRARRVSLPNPTRPIASLRCSGG